MLKNILISALFILSIVLGIHQNYAQNADAQKSWYKGNLHAHSYWSDGDDFPEMIMDWYKKNGYHFTVLSDHNTLQEGDKWIKISNKTYLQQGFENYLQKYGEDWVTYKMDSAGGIHVKLKTLKEYAPLFNDKNFLILPSEEVTTGFEGKPIHINATNIQEKITPLKGDTKNEVIQKNIEAIYAQREKLNVPIMPHLNHPNFGFAISPDDIIALQNLQFFEVYNGHPLVYNQGDSLHPSTEEIWDKVNASYIKQGKPLLYGVASDDSHQYHQFGKKYSNAGRGWVMVNATALDPGAIIEAMENGDFYASTGVIVEKYGISNDKITVALPKKHGTHYIIELIGVPNGSEKPQIIEGTMGDKAVFTVPDNYLFVRIRITSNKTNKNFFDETEFEKAWLQPFVSKK